MKNLQILFSLLLIAIPLALYGQGSWLEATNISGNGDIIVNKMDIDSNNDVFIAGWFTNDIYSTVDTISSAGNYDVFLMKINSDGSPAWLKGFGGIFPDLPGNVVVGPDNTIYLSGSFNGTVFFDETTSLTSTNADAFIANYNSDGSLNWAKIAAGGPKNQRAEAMDVDNDRIIIAGLGVDSVIYDVERVGYLGFFTHISTYDLDGNHLDYNIMGFKDVGLPTFIASTTDGFAITGYFRDSIYFDIDSLFNSSTSPSSDAYIYKVDKDLNGQWVRRTTTTGGEQVLYSVEFDGDDHLYCVGKASSYNMQIDSTDSEKITDNRTEGGAQFMILNYRNSTGNLEWYNIDGSNRDDALYDIEVLPDKILSTGFTIGNYYFGNDSLMNPLEKEIFLIEHDLDGNVIHARDAFSDPVRDSDQGYRVAQNQSGEIYVAGVYRSEVINFEETQFINSSPGNPDMFLAKFGCRGDGNLVTSSEDLLCYNDSSGEITINATGGFTNEHYGHAYDLLFDNGEEVINRKTGSPFTLTGLAPGTYDITVYDNANCLIGTSQEVITQPDSLQYSFTVVHPDCHSAETGSISIAASGGTAPYQYSINCGMDFQAEADFTGLAAGDYCIVIKDANGCQAPTVDTTLVQPDSLVFSFAVPKPVLTCFGDTDAEIHFGDVSGGTGLYSYSIDGGANYQADTFFQNLGAGDYQLKVMDENSCTTMQVDTSITQPDQLSLEFTIEQPGCFGELGTIFLSGAEGGSGSYLYSISEEPDFSIDTIYPDLPAGSYTLVAQDDNLCQSVPIDTSIHIPPELVIDSVKSEHIVGDQPGFIEVFASGGTPPISYTLQMNNITQDSGRFEFSGEEEAGAYYVEVDDVNRCGPVNTAIIIIDYLIDHTDAAEWIDAAIYPNPTSGQVTIEFSYEKPEALLEIMNLSGQKMISLKLHTVAGLVKETLDVSSLSNGIYLLRIDGYAIRTGIMIR